MRLVNQLAANHHKRIGEEAQTIRPSRPPKTPNHSARATGRNRVNPTASTAALALLGGSAAAATAYLIYASLSAVGTSLGKGGLLANTPGGPLTIPFQNGHIETPSLVTTPPMPHGFPIEGYSPPADHSAVASHHAPIPEPMPPKTVETVSSSELETAIRNRNATAVRDILTQDQDLLTPAMVTLAIGQSSREVAQTILDFNPDLNNGYPADTTPLKQALQTTEMTPEVVQKMIEKGADNTHLFETGFQVGDLRPWSTAPKLWAAFPRDGIDFPDPRTLEYMESLGMLTATRVGGNPAFPTTNYTYTFDVSHMDSACRIYDPSATSFSAEQQRQISGVLGWFSEHIALSFQPAETPTRESLCFGLSNTVDYPALANTFVSQRLNRVFFNRALIDDATSFAPGTYNALAAAHEIEHALGFNHPIPLYGLTDQTMMSYYDDSSRPTQYDPNTNLRIYPETPRPLDLQLLRLTYGINPNFDRNEPVAILATDRPSNRLIDSSDIDMRALSNSPTIFHTQNDWQNSKPSIVYAISLLERRTQHIFSGMPDNPVRTFQGPESATLLYDAPVNQTLQFGRCPTLVRLGLGANYANTTATIFHNGPLHLQFTTGGWTWRSAEQPDKRWQITSMEGSPVDVAGWATPQGTRLQFWTEGQGPRTIELPNTPFDQADDLFTPVDGNRLLSFGCEDNSFFVIALPVILGGVTLAAIIAAAILCSRKKSAQHPTPTLPASALNTQPTPHSAASALQIPVEV
ncbi:MAG: hypothetical protein AB7F28_04090 [Candidatus Margulisiibacteriota bacterium]